jgi:hypothetical protein
MNDRKILRFDERGCAIVVVATEADGKWYSYFDLKCPPNTKQYYLSGRDGPFASAENAFEKAKEWARHEIEEFRLGRLH